MQIVFFDGFCNLCNGFIDWLIRNDKKGVFKVASLQGETAKKHLPADLVSDGTDVSTIVYLRGDQQLKNSDAVLTIMKDLGGIWGLGGGLFIFPLFIRDGVYNWTARNRYKIFGKRNSCRMPTSDERARFLP